MGKQSKKDSDDKKKFNPNTLALIALIVIAILYFVRGYFPALV